MTQAATGFSRKWGDLRAAAGWASGLVRRRAPGQLVIQFTDRCNARCPQCGMRVTERFERSTLSEGSVLRIIDSAAEKGYSAVSFTGGEPLLHFEEIMSLSRYAAERGIRYVRTGTNGFLFMHSDRPDFRERVSRIAESISESGLYTFWISIDSVVPEVHESMRGLPDVLRGIEKALPIFHEHGVYPSANLGINRNLSGKPPSPGLEPEEFRLHFLQGFRRFYRFVSELGFTIANACYPMSVEDGSDGLEAVYGATSRADVITFSREEKLQLYRALQDAIPEFRGKIRIFTPLSALHALIGEHEGKGIPGEPCRGGIDYFFIEARSGDTFPCGYRGGENLGKFWEMKEAGFPGASPCRKCDWECFRDPSTLLGPFLRFRDDPAGVLRRHAADPRFHRLWKDDLRYMKACGFFNGKRPPDYAKLMAFAASG